MSMYQDKICPISLHELTACIYYKLAINRGVRGCMPDEEHICHRSVNISNSIKGVNGYCSADKGCENDINSPKEVCDSDLRDALR